MFLTLNPRQHAMHIVQAADQARAQVKTHGLKHRRGRGLVDYRQAGAQRVVDDGLEWKAPLLAVCSRRAATSLSRVKVVLMT